MNYALGVDLGTTFTRAALCRPGDQPVTVPVDGRQLAPAHGFRRGLGDPTPIVLDDGPHPAADLLSSTLSGIVEQVTRAQGAAPGRVVVTCPASWGAYRRQEFRGIPRRAGLPDDGVTVLAEAVAAARHHATTHPFTDGELLAVYDLGGETFDATVIRAGVGILGIPEGLAWVGGQALDDAVLGHVDQACDGAVSALDDADPEQARARQAVRDACVAARERLTLENEVTIAVLTPGREQEVALTRDRFEELIRPTIESTVQALRRTVASAEVTADDLSGVLLTGGCSQIPLVRDMIEKELGRPVLATPDAQHSVARGAAIFGSELLPPPAPPSPPGRIATTVATAIVVATTSGLLSFWLTQLLWGR